MVSDGPESDDPRTIPSHRCLSDPAVQAGAARLQTTITIIMGSLSALTTGWWGAFGEKHGRMRVLAASTFGLFLTIHTKLTIRIPRPQILIAAPFFEGLLGGFPTLQAATTAYVSDCTSAGSRAQIFSRFTGVFFVGTSLGPIIGAFLISHPWSGNTRSVTAVFWVAIACSFVNLILVLFVFPESLTLDKRSSKAQGKSRATGSISEDSTDSKSPGIVRAFLSPLAVFFPETVFVRGKERTDWSMTVLAIASFGYLITTGIYQIKYLYATHAYGWGAEQLSYYISLLSGSRAVQLLLVFPFIIVTFKPKSIPTDSSPKAAKAHLAKAHLAKEINFDLHLLRFSLLLDVISSSSIVAAPYPIYTDSLTPSAQVSMSQALFIAASSMGSLASGALPAAQSLSLCILQSRALTRQKNGETVDTAALGAGKLFGALAVLQAVGQMILGPMTFGLIYSGTVATHPKAIFVTAASILFAALGLTFFVRPPHARVVVPSKDGKTAMSVKPVIKRRARRVEVEVVRGRSRASKDLSKTFTFAGPSHF